MAAVCEALVHEIFSTCDLAAVKSCESCDTSICPAHLGDKTRCRRCTAFERAEIVRLSAWLVANRDPMTVRSSGLVWLVGPLLWEYDDTQRGLSSCMLESGIDADGEIVCLATGNFKGTRGLYSPTDLLIALWRRCSPPLPE